jgi:hypothetical protein
MFTSSEVSNFKLRIEDAVEIWVHSLFRINTTGQVCYQSTLCGERGSAGDGYRGSTGDGESGSTGDGESGSTGDGESEGKGDGESEGKGDDGGRGSKGGDGELRSKLGKYLNDDRQMPIPDPIIEMSKNVM